MTIDVKMPRSWQELNQEQMSYYFWLSMKFPESQVEYILSYCFIRWSNMQVIRRYEDNSVDVKTSDGMLINLRPEKIAESIQSLRWLTEIPDYPVRLSTVGQRTAISETMEELTFENYLMCENLYQGYLRTQSGELIDQIGNALYSGPKKSFADDARLMIFFWWASFKNFCSMQYRYLFNGAPGETEESLHKRLMDSMNSQIRALTQGDITKEREVLSMPVHRALTELDAKARDYEEINKKKS